MKPFNSDRFYLGTLCQRGHEFDNTGKSLRYRSGASNCATCAIEYRRARDAKKRAARLAAAPVYPPGMKKCPACETLVPVADWRCVPCKAAWHKSYNEKNKAKHRAQTKALRQKFRAENWALSLWRGARTTSRTRGLSFLIAAEHLTDLWERQGGRCYWTGAQLLTACERRHLLRVSIDRVDPSRGYEEGNVVLSSIFANIGRGNATPEATVAALDTMFASYHVKFAEALR